MTTVDSGTRHTAEALAERILAAGLAALDLQSVQLGDRLGYYRALAAADDLTPAELAARTGTAERYAREWLEQQAVTGILTVTDDPDRPGEAGARRFTLPDGHAEALTDVLSPAYVAWMSKLIGSFGRQADAIADAYRSGGGVSWEQLGDDAREAQAAANRPMFLGALGREYLPSIPVVDAALRAGGRVADIGCGMGWSSIGIALAYPDAGVDGYDVDAPSIEAARRNATESGVSGRVRFHTADASAIAAGATYDLVLAVECIHDLPDPVGVLAAMRRLAGESGTVIVADERVAESFTAPGDEIERLMYGYSLMCCLPDGMAHRGSAATGTVMRPSTLRSYAEQAGFTGLEVLDVQDDFFRFYRLTTR
jgi:2-polyprenyl-3-methyl-5-hydroxy-6-metoxy-1,4-benzoquinol methylase